MALGRTPTTSFRRAEEPHVQQASPEATRLHPEVLSSSRRFGLRRGRRTLAGGRYHNHFTRKTLRTKTASHCILLGNVHSYRKELRHLRARATGNYEIPCALETLSRMDTRTIYYPHRPCQPAVLESTKKSQQTYSQMARGPPRVRLRNQTHTRKYKHTCGRIIKTTRRRQRRRRQSKRHDNPAREIPSFSSSNTRNGHQSSRRRFRRIVGTTNSEGTK
jgi:hypothetical protein